MSLGSWRRGVDAGAGRPSALAVVGGGGARALASRRRRRAPCSGLRGEGQGERRDGETVMVTVAVTVTARRGEGCKGCGERWGAAPRGRGGGGARRGRVGEGGRRRRREGCVRAALSGPTLARSVSLPSREEHPACLTVADLDRT